MFCKYHGTVSAVKKRLAFHHTRSRIRNCLGSNPTIYTHHSRSWYHIRWHAGVFKTNANYTILLCDASAISELKSKANAFACFVYGWTYCEHNRDQDCLAGKVDDTDLKPINSARAHMSGCSKQPMSAQWKKWHHFCEIYLQWVFSVEVVEAEGHCTTASGPINKIDECTAQKKETMSLRNGN